jgi:F-type H+-transporting ATPase subunit b
VISLDSSLLYQIVNFVVLIFILNALLYKPLLGIIDKRNKLSEDSRAEVDRLNQAVGQKMAEYEEKLRDAKAAAMEQKNMITAEGSEKAKGIIAAVREEIPKMMEQFQGSIAKEIGEAKRILRDQSQKISVEIAEKVLGRSIQ